MTVQSCEVRARQATGVKGKQQARIEVLAGDLLPAAAGASDAICKIIRDRSATPIRVWVPLMLIPLWLRENRTATGPTTTAQGSENDGEVSNTESLTMETVSQAGYGRRVLVIEDAASLLRHLDGMATTLSLPDELEGLEPVDKSLDVLTVPLTKLRNDGGSSSSRTASLVKLDSLAPFDELHVDLAKLLTDSADPDTLQQALEVLSVALGVDLRGVGDDSDEVEVEDAGFDVDQPEVISLIWDD